MNNNTNKHIDENSDLLGNINVNNYKYFKIKENELNDEFNKNHTKNHTKYYSNTYIDYYSNESFIEKLEEDSLENSILFKKKPKRYENDRLLKNFDNEILDNVKIKNIYNYYYKGGYKNIIIENINSLFINYFLLFLINFITNCVDYKKVYYFNNDNDSSMININEFIKIDKWFPSNWYLLISLILYLIYLINFTFNTINNIKLCITIKKIYDDKLEILEKELKYYTWHEIVNIILNKYTDPNLNIYTINAIICQEDNLMIYFLRHKLIDSSYISTLLEINIHYCFINSLVTTNYKITKETMISYYDKIKTRLLIVILINLITLPFSLYVILIYNIINYGENLYNNPSFLFNRIWTTKAKWRLKFYNELPHEFDKRMLKLSDNVNIIINSNQNREFYNIFKFINFVFGSLFVMLIILSIINEDILTKCDIFEGRSVLWTIGIIGSIILLIKKLNKTEGYINENLLLNNLEEIKNTIGSINPHWFDDNIRYQLIKLLKSMYQNKINIIFYEIINVLLSPYYLFIWLYNYKNIKINYIISNQFVLGYVCKYSIFTNYNLIKSDAHMYYSVNEFKNNNPDWNDNLLILPNKTSESNQMYKTFNWEENTKVINDVSFSTNINSSYILNN